MISSHLHHWRSVPGLAGHPVWTAAFSWIQTHAATAAEGWFDLDVGNARVRVMSYPTKQREDAAYEAHREMIDIQYTILGSEKIEVSPTAVLTPTGPYDADEDLQFFETPENSEVEIENVPGRFCILYPEDAHMPQLAAPGHTRVRKLVVKIPVSAVVDTDQD